MASGHTEDLGQIKGPLKPLEKKPRIFTKILRFLCVVIFVVGICSFANFLYLRISFGDSFFVNGLSMYPTLNKDGSRLENGKYRALRWNDGGNQVGDIIDYGWGKTDEGKGWRQDLRRYDLVITYYPSDYKNVDHSELYETASLKIKRLIGFPGETITISDDASYFGNSVWAKTTVTQTDGTKKDLPNLYSEDDFPTIVNADGSSLSYTSIPFPEGNFSTWTLGEDEYFVMGDNRRGTFSGDSRAIGVGPIKRHMLKGKVHVLTGMAKVEKASDGNIEGKMMLSRMRMPWNYVDLTKNAL